MKKITEHLLLALKLFSFPLFIIFIHAVLSEYEAYRIISWVDIPMHFFGGVSVGITYTLVLRELRKGSYVGEMRTPLLFLFVVCLVGTTAVGWEFYEFASDYFFRTHAQPSFVDTMEDMFLGLCGGVLGYFLAFERLRKETISF